MNDEEIVVTEVTEVTVAEDPPKKEKKKNKKLGKVIAYAVVFLILGCVVTGLSAVLPTLPYTFTKTEQIRTVGYGFPLKFAEQTRTDDEMTALTDGDCNKNVNKAFILPRYDLFETEWSIGNAVADIFINTAVIAATIGRADRANGTYVLKATVNGEACAVTQDGAAVAALTKGTNEARYETDAHGLSELVLTADAFGSTVVSSLKSESGLSFILR